MHNKGGDILGVVEGKEKTYEQISKLSGEFAKGISDRG